MATINGSQNFSRKKRSRRTLDQQFSNYMVFGVVSTGCLVYFFLCYALVLYCLWPLLNSNPVIIPDENARDYVHNPHLPPSLTEAHIPGQDKFKRMTGAVKKKLRQVRQRRGITDEELLLQAAKEFDMTRKERDNLQQGGNLKVKDTTPNPVADEAIKKRNGFMVLGMHRSGTSMLSGLLVSGCGYNVGKSNELIGASFDNEKGFFERVDVVLQNDQFMYEQDMAWSYNVINYDSERALNAKESMEIDFKHGKTGLAFLNDPQNNPWLQKDPRMCITLKTWLKLMNNEPAILFTYRHPLEVARSLAKREPGFSIMRGLRLWIVYNMRAIQNSKGLCVVRSSNTKVLADPLGETKRIASELTNKCGLIAPPREITQTDIDKFVDPNLQHNKKQSNNDKDKRILEEWNDGACKVYEYDMEESQNQEYELKLYKAAMKMYCDFEAGIYPGDDYNWPELAP